jgi:hypothetical protein
MEFKVTSLIAFLVITLSNIPVNNPKLKSITSNPADLCSIVLRKNELIMVVVVFSYYNFFIFYIPT